MQPTTILISITPGEFKGFVREVVREELLQLKPKEVKNKDDDIIKGEEVMKIFDISYPTLLEWRKKGIIKAYKLGNRIFYKRSEILESLKKIERKQV